MQAHGGTVLHHAGRFYWYGVKNAGYTYFNENNLLRWEGNSRLLHPGWNTDAQTHRDDLSSTK